MIFQEKTLLLTARRLPAKLTDDEIAVLLGISESTVPVLIKAKLLKPLGHPPKYAPKFFATADWEKLRDDTHWLAKAADAIVFYHHDRNAKKTPPSSET